jgi:ABC-type multidrug transport system ATPase subunit
MSQAAAVPAGRPSASISVEGLRHVYKGGTVALDGVDLEIGTGLFGLLGPNGAGKSTLMRIMCTLLVPTAGRASVGGHDVVRERRAVRRLVGYLPQEFGAWRLQRVEEVVDTLARLSGVSDKATRRTRVREVLEQVGLDEVADRKVKKLSGGMVRRLGVAQALVHEPQVLVVDEPTVGLDPEERLRFRQLMTSLGQDRTIVLSTHIVADIGSGCSDMALIDDGKIVFRGDPAELVSRARGTVFQVPEAGLGAGFEVVSRTKNAEGVHVRAVGKAGQLPADARIAENPTLEEAYLSFMVARDRADAARAVEEGA